VFSVQLYENEGNEQKTKQNKQKHFIPDYTLLIVQDYIWSHVSCGLLVHLQVGYEGALPAPA
jgi:hypothetical protein